MGALLGGAEEEGCAGLDVGAARPATVVLIRSRTVPSPHAGRHQCGALVHRPTPLSYMNQHECKEYNPIARADKAKGNPYDWVGWICDGLLWESNAGKRTVSPSLLS